MWQLSFDPLASQLPRHLRTLLLLAATLLRQRGWPARQTGCDRQLSLHVQGDGADISVSICLPYPLSLLLAWPASFQIETVS